MITTGESKGWLPLGELLVSRGVMSSSAISFCLHEQKITGERFGQVVERCGFAPHVSVLQALCEQLQLSYVDVNTLDVDPDVLPLFTATLCRKNQFLPIERYEDKVVVVTSYYDLHFLQELIARISGLEVVIKLGERDKINRAITHYYINSGRSAEYVLEREIAGFIADKDAAQKLDPLIHGLAALAINRRATDIHIRPMEHSINIAFRIDGVLHSVFSLDTEFQRLISTVKLMSEMDIAETRRSQDGSFDIKIDEAYYDIRVSSISCSHGENLVMRILSRDQDVRRLANLGFYDEHMDLLLEMFRRPSGIFLVTGPTGSGKSTTLHAGIMSLDVLNKNIMTIEDPIEYQLPVVRQTQVNVKAGYVFSGAIRSFLRHDPDVIVVGEIRDSETASAALDAAETGHLVLSTMHTNNAIGIVPRLRSLHADTHQLADVLVGALSQRLVRKICPSCKTFRVPTIQERSYLGITDKVLLAEGMGCDLCHGTGFLGRIPVYEIVEFSDSLRAAVHDSKSLQEMYKIAQTNNYVSMFSVAKARVLAGETTLDEVKYYAFPPEVN